MLLLAPDKFKGTLGAAEVAAALAEGAERSLAEAAAAWSVERCPVADGGEGTLAVLEQPLGLVRRSVEVLGPLGEPVQAALGMSDDRSLAVVELAEASGLWRVPPAARDPTRTTSFGTGQLLRAAMELGARRLVVALGGSATCDGGVGLAQALGVRFLDAAGAVLPAPLCGAALLGVASWSAANSLVDRCRAAGGSIEAAVDVDRPLCGPLGAARLFGPQKGATPGQVQLLERAMVHLAQTPGDRQASTAAQDRFVATPLRAAAADAILRCRAEVAGEMSSAAIAQWPGSGAAGGCGFGLAAYCGATLRCGADLVLDALGFEERLRRAALVVAGEGRFDVSSLAGKASMAVVRRAQRCAVPAVIVAGDVERASVGALGEPAPEIISLVERFGRRRALEDTAACLRETGAWLIDRMLR